MAAPLVESDNRTAIRQGVEYLVGMGHRRIGFVGGALDIANMRDRYDGYLRQMDASDPEVDRDWIIDDLAAVGTPNGIEGTWRLLGRRNLPSAIICANESVAMGAYEVLKARGIRIPEDISVLSVDDTPLSSVIQPPITTFGQHLVTMGERAVDLLMDLIHEPEGTDPKRTSSSRSRSSCGTRSGRVSPPPARHPPDLRIRTLRAAGPVSATVA